MSENLTGAQARVHAAMLDYQAAHGLPATIRELSEALGFTSTNAVHEHLRILERKGYVSHQRTNKSRGWVAHQRGSEPREAFLAALRETMDVRRDVPIARILMGAAGSNGLASRSDVELADDLRRYARNVRCSDG